MSLTLKQILDIALGSTGVNVPATWIGSNNLATANLVKAIANQSVLALREYPLQSGSGFHGLLGLIVFAPLCVPM